MREKTNFPHNNNYIDLFSGCGGLSLGLGWAGWDGVFAIEKDSMAYSTFDHNLVDENAPYRHFTNWPSWLPRTAHTIEEVLENEEMLQHIKELSGKITLVAGGPPCQGFSVAGARNGNDPRNLLVFKQIRVVEVLKPMFAIIENVEGFEKKFVNRPIDDVTLSVADEAMIQLENIGYNVGKVTINAADYGVPQLRKRVIIFAISKQYIQNVVAEEFLRDILEKVSVEQRTELLLAAERYVTVEEALSDLAGTEMVDEPEYAGYKTAKYLPINSSYQALMRKNIPQQEIPSSHRFNKHGEKVVALYECAIKTQPPGRISKEFLFEHGCHSNKRYVLDITRPCSTVTTAPEELIHFSIPRCVTLREMARLQSFPDDYTFYGRYTLNGPCRGIDVPRNAQIGNAIPPLLGRALGKALAYIKEMIYTNDSALKKYRYEVVTKKTNHDSIGKKEDNAMSENKKKSHARIVYDPIKEPCPTPSPDLVDRDKWIEEVYAGFVSPSNSNKKYYKVILETLWPKGHGIPGPLVDGSQIRKAIDDYRGKPYVDTFRRMRELQGEEGLLGIIKGGNKYQLIDLSVSQKRIPRTHLNDNDWGIVLNNYHGVCAACGKSPEASGFQQEHKVPRLRGGSDELANWQPLCDECNNFKSTACRDCQLDCQDCCWAFPEKYKPLKLSGDLVRRIRAYALAVGRLPEDMVTEWINEKLPGT